LQWILHKTRGVLSYVVSQSKTTPKSSNSPQPQNTNKRNEPHRFSHGESRSLVCLFDFKKINKRKTRFIELPSSDGAIEEKLEALFPSYSIHDQRLPKVICFSHKQAFLRQKNANVKLIELEDYLKSLPPVKALTRSNPTCECKVCTEANATFQPHAKKSRKASFAPVTQSSTSTPPPTITRCSSSDSASSTSSSTSSSTCSSTTPRAVSPETEGTCSFSPASSKHSANSQLQQQRLCGACLQEVRRGVRHPCSAASRKRNVSNILTRQEKETIASEILRKRDNGGKVVLHTGGRPQTLFISTEKLDLMQYTHEEIDDLLEEVGATSMDAGEKFCKRMRQIHSTDNLKPKLTSSS